jgi:hypothetical protein
VKLLLHVIPSLYKKRSHYFIHGRKPIPIVLKRYILFVKIFILFLAPYSVSRNVFAQTEGIKPSQTAKRKEKTCFI